MTTRNANAKRDKQKASAIRLGVELFCDAFHGVMSREDGALLPADEVREVVAGEVGLALRLFKPDVSRLAAGEKIVREAAERVRDSGPVDVDGLGQQVGAARMEEFDCFAGGIEL